MARPLADASQRACSANAASSVLNQAMGSLSRRLVAAGLDTAAFDAATAALGAASLEPADLGSADFGSADFDAAGLGAAAAAFCVMRALNRLRRES